jgi:hypothetical protein
MTTRRAMALDALLALPAQYQQRYAGSTAATKVLCKRYGSLLCTTLMFGALQKCIELLQDPKTIRACNSIEQVVSMFYNMCNFLPEFLDYSVGSNTSACWHDECNFLSKMLEDVNQIVESVEGLELEQFRQSVAPATYI